MVSTEFYKELIKRMLKLGRNAFLLRLFIKYLTDGMKIKLLFKGIDTVFRFALATVGFASLYHLLRRLFAFLR